MRCLKLYKDVIDIYLPDFKYGNNDYGRRLSKIPDYFDKCKLALKEMYEQVGSELVYENGVVVRGLIIRHLVLPNGLADTEEVFKFISKELDPRIHLSVMSQYYPTNRSSRNVLIDRKVSHREYDRVLDLLDKYGLETGWVQEMESNDFYRPEFEKDRVDPFQQQTTNNLKSGLTSVQFLQHSFPSCDDNLDTWSFPILPTVKYFDSG